MHFDIFFSLSHTPVDAYLPSEKQLFQNFFAQVKAADNLGYRTAWVAESHLSSQTQKLHPQPVIPHWQGEVGINSDIFQLSHMVFDRTENIEMGSAVMNLLTNGGPIAAAERVATFLSLHSLREQPRRLRIGFSAGRFDYMTNAYGVSPRSDFEKKYWPLVKTQIFAEATEIFLRLISKQEISSEDIKTRYLGPQHFTDQAAWKEAQAFYPKSTGQIPFDQIPIDKFYHFKKLKIVPQEYDLSLLDLTIGSHVASLQDEANTHLPVKVFNLSITKPEIIEETHQRMKHSYHHDGGPWQRSFMPRTTFVFINEENGLSPKERTLKAKEEARKALSAYWTALEGTVDPKKILEAADNALIGTADDISYQIKQRFHDDDTLMLWFDFFNHDNDRVIQNMEAFKHKVAARFDTSPGAPIEILKR